MKRAIAALLALGMLLTLTPVLAERTPGNFILITMYNGRLNLSVQVMEELQKYYPGKIFETPITRNVKLSEAPSFGEPVWYYDKYSKGAQQYMEIAKELLEKI